MHLAMHRDEVNIFIFFHYSKLGGSIAKGTGRVVKAKKQMRPRRLEAPGMTQSVTLGGGFGQIGRIQAAWDGLFCLNHCGRRQATSKVDHRQIHMIFSSYSRIKPI